MNFGVGGVLRIVQKILKRFGGIFFTVEFAVKRAQKKLRALTQRARMRPDKLLDAFELPQCFFTAAGRVIDDGQIGRRLAFYEGKFFLARFEDFDGPIDLARLLKTGGLFEISRRRFGGRRLIRIGKTVGRVGARVGDVPFERIDAL